MDDTFFSSCAVEKVFLHTGHIEILLVCRRGGNAVVGGVDGLGDADCVILKA